MSLIRKALSPLLAVWPLFSRAIDITASPKNCHEISFSKGWSSPVQNGTIGSLDTVLSGYDFRQDATSPKMLVRGYLGGHVDGNKLNYKYAMSVYEVDLSRKDSKPTLSSVARWEAAQILPAKRFPSVAVKPEPLDSQPISISGKLFPKTGARWASPARFESVRQTLDGTRVALQSFTGPMTLLEGDILTPNRDRGQVYFEFFDVSSSAKIGTVEGRYNGYGIDRRNYSMWVNRRFFILPLDYDFKHAFVCDFGQ